MRQRRAERCVLRAEAALQSGDEAAAIEALAEAKALDWNAPEFDALRASVVEKKTAAAAAAAARAAALQRAARLQRTRRTIAAAALGITAFGGSAALMYKAASKEATPGPSPVTLAQPLPSPSRADRAESGSPVPLANGPVASEGTRAATPDQGLAAGKAVSPVPTPKGPTAENLVVVDPPPRVQEQLAVRRETGTTPAPDVPVRTTATRGDDAPLNTPQVAASPFAVAPGSVAAVPLPPVAPAEEDSPRPAPVTATAPTVPAPAAPLPAVDEAARVRSVLSRYEEAYSRLDADAAQSVWPGVDGRVLARAFQGLQSQRVSLGQCALAIDGSTARADCDGSATWTPKIGGGSRTEARHYRFELQNTTGGWQILTASAR